MKFTLPSSSKGTLYYKYDKSGEDKISSSDKFYYSDSPALEDLSFVPAKNWSGTVSIEFSGRNSKNASFSGTVSITVSKSSQSISYTVEDVYKRQAQREEYYNEAQLICIDDCTKICIASPMKYFVTASYVEGFAPSAADASNFRDTNLAR